MQARALRQWARSFTGILSSTQASGRRGHGALRERRFSEWSRICAVFVFSLLTEIVSPAQTYAVLTTFNGTDGASPVSLVQGFDGNLYGVTTSGGKCVPDGGGCGVVFKITPDGTLTTLYSFCAQNACSDGRTPLAVTQAIDGNLYGTTMNGGKWANIASIGAGTIFKITPTGTLTTLYRFCAQKNCSDGVAPTALTQAADGSLYGTTHYGGGVNCGSATGCGTVFKITPSGTLTTLYRFCSQSNCPDGANPSPGPVQATDGNFYGTTAFGGVTNGCAFIHGGPGGCGTVFKITSSGTLTTLYRFCPQTGCTDGNIPNTALVQGANGNVYGTTFGGGVNNSICSTADECGTVFSMTPGGTLTTLYQFCSQTNCIDGFNPSLPLIQATDGNFYGGTQKGGANNSGTLFNITPSGAVTTLHNFCGGCGDGTSPSALIQDTDGNFYGTTAVGGTGEGIAFKLSTGLGPFVKTIPTSGKVGAAVTILGTNLTGATSVSFHGTTATFTVVSSSEITTTVPAGATTGKVTVTAPSGTLKSNVVFRVRP